MPPDHPIGGSRWLILLGMQVVHHIVMAIQVWRRLAVVFCVLGLLACDRVQIEVHVEGVTSDIDSLQVQVLLDRKPLAAVPRQVNSFLGHFILELPPKQAGLAELQIGAVSASGCQHKFGYATIETEASKHYDVTVQLVDGEPACRLTVTRTGEGSGQVEVVAGADVKICQFAKTSPDQACEFFFPLATEVTVQAIAAPDDYFAGWSGECNSTEPCRFRVRNEPHRLSAGFMSRQVCSRDGWCWQNPLIQGNDLWRIVPTSDPKQRYWAIGSYGTILRWNGQYWSPLPSGTTRNLYGIWQNSAQDSWIVGSAGTILHWDGQKVSAVPSGTDEDLVAIWGSSANDIWAVGGEVGLIMHWDGAAWHTVLSGDDLGSPSSPSQTRAVWGSSASDVWVVGQGGIASSYAAWHWNGSTWKYFNLAPPLTSLVALNDIWGTGPMDVWVVGSLGAIFHWDGATWSQSPTSIDKDLQAIWGNGTSAWSSGSAGTLLRLSGSTWSTINSGGYDDLHSVAGATADDAWAVGEKGVLRHFNGVVWSYDRYSSISSSITALSGTGAGAVYAISEHKDLLRWDGTSWQKQFITGQDGDDLRGLWASAPNEVWIVGDRAVLHHDADGWREYRDGISRLPMAVGGGTPDEVWIVGIQGEILRWTKGVDDLAVFRRGVKNRPALLAVAGTSAHDVWMVGEQGSVLRWNGKSLDKVKSPAKEMLQAIWANAPDDVWIGGVYGALLHWDGTALAQVPLPEAASVHNIRGIWSSRRDDVWVAGSNGRIVHWDGNSWAAVQSGTPNSFSGLWGSRDGQHLWAVGENGMILHRQFGPGQ